MNGYIAVLCEVGPAQASGIELLRELLGRDNLTIEELMRRQDEIERAEDELERLSLRCREAVQRCADLRALPVRTQAPTGF